MRAIVSIALVVLLAMALPAFAENKTHHRIVNSTAYTSRPAEIVNKKSKKTACADKLDQKEAAQTMAVSLDLVKAGLDCGSAVTVEGFAGDFVVNDHLPKRARNRIDIFLGKDVKDAKGWGRRKVKISW